LKNIIILGKRYSEASTKGANGTVHVSQDANIGVRLKSTWATVEYPILKNKNNIIYHYD